MRLAFTILMASAAITLAEESPPAFRMTLRRSEDRVSVTQEKSATRFTIHSPSGIGHVRIERTQRAWPDRVTLRLHLNGLENLQVTSGDVTVAAAVAIPEGKPVTRVWRMDEEESPLDATSPLWIELQPLTADGKPAQSLPLQNGSIDVTLPKALLQTNPQSITVRWIDFYRH